MRGPELDEVDRVVAAWERERPDLRPEPLHVFSRVSRLARHLDIYRRAAFARHRIEAWEFEVLSSLRRAGAPYEMTPGHLVHDALVSSGTMTNRLERLAARGFITRRVSRADKRVKHVRLTEEGKAVVDAAMSSLLDAERDLLRDLDRRERAALASSLRQLLMPFDGC